MNEKIIIGLAGVKTSGKSTVTKMIQKYIDATEVAFADKLKNGCASVFGLTREQFDRQDLKEVPFAEPMYLDSRKTALLFDMFNIDFESERELDSNLGHVMEIPLDSPRKIAQIVGTQLLREHGGADVHCRNLELNEGANIVSDLRFPNEFEHLDNMEDVKFVGIYLKRDVAEALVDMETSHASETSVFLFNDKCIELRNNGTLEETEGQVRQILVDNGVIGA